ncbi:hypothetical protein N8482_01795 [Chitinophagales bacterium]|nr:hypothetical protein [Chitinophagales bacterium]
MTKKNFDPQDGTLTTAMNVNSREFQEFQLFLSEKAKSLGEKQKVRIDLLALQIKIEDYLNSTISSNEMISVGDFLRLYLERLNIKQNKMADYVGLRPSNFSKILSGSRKVSFELSFILSRIFSLDPEAWMLIQVKNECLELKEDREEYFQDFKLDDLID